MVDPNATPQPLQFLPNGYAPMHSQIQNVKYIHRHTYIHNKSYSAQSYIKTERLSITEVQTYTK